MKRISRATKAHIRISGVHVGAHLRRDFKRIPLVSESPMSAYAIFIIVASIVALIFTAYVYSDVLSDDCAFIFLGAAGSIILFAVAFAMAEGDSDDVGIPIIFGILFVVIACQPVFRNWYDVAPLAICYFICLVAEIVFGITVLALTG